MNSLKSMQKVYHILSDEESRFTWLNRMNYLITDDFTYMKAVIDAYLPGLPAYGIRIADKLLSVIPQDTGFVLFGAGSIGGVILSRFKDDERFRGFCSSTIEKQKNGFCGYPVISPEKLIDQKDLSVIVCADIRKGEILDILSAGRYPEDLIFTIDGIDASYNEQYFGPDFIHYEAEEVFVDAGCFDLCSSLDLREKCGKLRKVYAFEPDPENYKVCVRNKEKYHFPEAEILPYGAWSEMKTLYFEAGGLGSSRVSNGGNTSIQVKSIDEVVRDNEKVTFIKMDIEGSELEALKGARRTIQRDKPKLAICIYHKPEDMTEIPLYIKSLVPEYKLYVRHHSNCFTETVLYAVLP